MKNLQPPSEEMGLINQIIAKQLTDRKIIEPQDKERSTLGILVPSPSFIQRSEKVWAKIRSSLILGLNSTGLVANKYFPGDKALPQILLIHIYRLSDLTQPTVQFISFTTFHHFHSTSSLWLIIDFFTKFETVAQEFTKIQKGNNERSINQQINFNCNKKNNC